MRKRHQLRDAHVQLQNVMLLVHSVCVEVSVARHSSLLMHSWYTYAYNNVLINSLNADRLT